MKTHFSNLAFLERYVTPALLSLVVPFVSLITFTVEDTHRPKYHTELTLLITLSVACPAITLLEWAIAAIGNVATARAGRIQCQVYTVFFYTLKTLAVAQAVAQGILIAFLSYWLTVAVSNKYYPIIAVVTCLFVVVALALVFIVAIGGLEGHNTIAVRGELLEPAQAPRLHQRVMELSMLLQTMKPEQVVVGIDYNFFLTDYPVKSNNAVHHGKTLYLNLSLLRILDSKEAEAILSHEISHFNERDQSTNLFRIATRNNKFLESVHSEFPEMSKILLGPIFGFHNSIAAYMNEKACEREIYADRTAIRTTNEKTLTSALIKISSHQHWESGRDLFSSQTIFQTPPKKTLITVMQLPTLTSDKPFLEEISKLHLRHPTDQHLCLGERLKTIGMCLGDLNNGTTIFREPTNSWYNDIDGADELVRRLWGTAIEELYATHEKNLATTLLPSSEKELEIVERHFPPLNFATKSGDGAVRLDCLGIAATWWARPILFFNIVSTKTVQKYGKPISISIESQENERSEKLTTQLDIQQLDPEFEKAFYHYLDRYLSALTHHRKDFQPK